MKLGDKPIVDEVDKISTGSISLDIALELVDFQKEELSKSMDQRALEKQPLRSMLSLNPKKWRYCCIY